MNKRYMAAWWLFVASATMALGYFGIKTPSGQILAQTSWSSADDSDNKGELVNREARPTAEPIDLDKYRNRRSEDKTYPPPPGHRWEVLSTRTLVAKHSKRLAWETPSADDFTGSEIIYGNKGAYGVDIIANEPILVCFDDSKVHIINPGEPWFEKWTYFRLLSMSDREVKVRYVEYVPVTIK